jgi:hypothetical protein
LENHGKKEAGGAMSTDTSEHNSWSGSDIDITFRIRLEE